MKAIITQQAMIPTFMKHSGPILLGYHVSLDHNDLPHNRIKLRDAGSFLSRNQKQARFLPEFQE